MSKQAIPSTASALPIAGAIMMAPPPAEAVIQNLRDSLEAVVEENEGIVALADEEERDLTDDEVETIEANNAKAEKLQRQIAARESALKPGQGTGRKTKAEPSNGPGRRPVPAQPRPADAGRGGFSSFGEFAICVRNAGVVEGEPDGRLRAAATTYGNEGTGADGGFAVPPEFRREIWEKVVGEESLLARTEQMVTGSNTFVIPKDETAPWDFTNGIQVYWESEAGRIAQTKPALEMATMRLNKLTGLVPVSEELLEDAPGMDSYLRAKAPVKMGAKLNTAIISGTGVGQPLGILNAPSLIRVAKETGQAADTVLFQNIVRMWSRMYAPARRRAVWLINQDIEPQLDTMAFVEGAPSPVPVYLPQGGLSSEGFATLKGRPVIPVEACPTLGDVGDVILTDLSQYMSVTKGQQIRTDVSMHLYFDQALTAFRFIFRVAGQSMWGRAIEPQHGSLTRSWAVALEERA